MKPYYFLLMKTRRLIACGRNLEVIQRQIMEDPSFDDYLREDRFNKGLTHEKKATVARKIIADAIHREAKRLV
jgi:hypothetical protein